MIRAKIASAAGAGLDRAALRLMTRLWLLGGDPNEVAAQRSQERAREVYTAPRLTEDPLLFFPEPPPARVAVGRGRTIRHGRLERWRFASEYQTFDPEYQTEWESWAENRTAHAECLLHDRREGPRPAVLCLHSWATGSYQLQRWAFFAGELYRAGYDVALLMLPFHGPRNPKGSWFGGQLFPGTCPRRTNEGFGQTIWDARRMLGALLARGATSVGVMGMSMGGYSSALLASVEPRLAFSIPIIPMVSFGDLLWSHGSSHPKRRQVEARGVTLEMVRALYRVHSPLELSPKLPTERLMIVAGQGDRICDPVHVRWLWEHWRRPEIHWFAGGHLAHFGRAGLVRAVLRFLGALPAR